MTVIEPSEQQYGSSVSVCDFILVHQLEQTKPCSIVDFGAGGGKNGRIARRVLGGDVRIVAVEGCKKTASMLAECEVYDEAYHSLIQDWIEHEEGDYGLAIFGDVLEHLKPREIHAVIRTCLKRFKQIIVVCPLHEIFQEETYGNPLEIHRTYVTSTFFDRYHLAEKHIISGPEWTILNVRICSESSSIPLYRRVSWAIFDRMVRILQPLGLARPFVNLLKRFAIRFKWLLRDQ